MKNVEVAKWLEKLPLAPEFRPTDTEFADPIAYISKIEREASAFGICKVIPPLPKPSRKYVLHNLNKSLSKCPELGTDVNLVTSSKTDTVAGNQCDRSVNDRESRAVFTTRQQELGSEKGKRTKGVAAEQVLGAQKHVWQSGEVYTLEQFEAKSKDFSRSHLGTVKDVNPLVVETLFWKAASEKPIYVEYANDVPGSAFDQPEGLLHYFRRRRRRRKRNSFDRNNIGSPSSKKDESDMLSSSVREDKESGNQNNSHLCTDTESNSLPSSLSRQGASSARKDSNSSNEMEGSAGWKLSNSPWNLQVIARSPGSLTRFMPDDIPGVTSPMVYIGMLFSWFAWHVEDHELHSLNFLHTGSPKTWYAVPGDDAFNFEEVICHHAHGGNTDRLVALSRLGEKTTVLSPEVIVASGIQCCRLVQNPGEFVVTFPRAYHIGFSHGFNCGEAANFATPKWLTVAKEAAVRRAAMNYLPMLSHQQLLSLLTMSFISSIPRSLLPGVRSSRSKDRQKEERELLVKRAFIQDILRENNLMGVLQRSSSYHTVLWDADLLPSLHKESVVCNDADASLSPLAKGCPENDDYVDHINPLNEYISAVGYDLNDDGLAYDFQIDSGSLPCVACGILGFPFMAVIQPSEAASKSLLHENPVADLNHLAEVSVKGVTNKAKSRGRNPSHFNETAKIAEISQSTSSLMEQSAAPDYNDGAGSSNVEIAKRWNVYSSFMKPRIFCLEHALEIEKLLSSKGGAKVLLICHSDFQKIKAHAAVVAEEIAIPFDYNEIPLGIASREDLNLIDIAISSEEQVDCEDWTSKLRVNLRKYLKVRKSSSTKDVQYLLTLDGCFSHGTPISNASSVKWLSRKFRSKRHLKHLLPSEACVGTRSTREDVTTNPAYEVAKKGDKIIQYSRKRYKSCNSSGREVPTGTNNLVLRDNTDTSCVDLVNKGQGSGGGILEQNSDSSAGKSESQCENNAHLLGGGCKNFSPSCCADDFVASTPINENGDEQTGICSLNKSMEEDKVGSSWHDCQADENKVADGSMERSKRCYSNNPGSHSLEHDKDCHETSTEKQTEHESGLASNTIIQLAENDCRMLLDGDDETEEPEGHPQIQKDADSREKASSRSTALSNSSTSDLIEEMHTANETLEAMGYQNDDSGSSHVQDKRNTGDAGPISKTVSKRKRETVGSDNDDSESSHVQENRELVDREPILKTRSKWKREDHIHFDGFIKSPCEGLRPRARKDTSGGIITDNKPTEKTPTLKKSKKPSDHKDKKGHQNKRYKCEIDGCRMTFELKSELVLHKSNRCPVDGCRKKFSSHKYAVQHQRVHDDDRPLKCPWKGCSMSFKWAWARTEHIRVHTGERPYVCKIKGCGLTFRFVSDYSRHRRKTGHYVDSTT